MKNIVLSGPPGVGKGTQANLLKGKYNLVHISTGDVFRFNIKNKTELGILAKTFMDKGDLVPDEVTINMLEAEVNKNIDANGFIFDGFPRTQSQAEALDGFLSTKGEKINGMVALEVPEDLLIERLLERGKTSGRADDTDEEKIRNRFNEYNTKTAILKDYYAAKGNYFGVNGVGSIQEINYFINDYLNLRLAYKYYDIQTDYASGKFSKPLTPNHRFFANISYETKQLKLNNQWKFDVTFNLIGEQRLPNTSTNPLQYQLDTYSNSYNLLNLQITKVFSKKFELYIGGENLTNLKQKNPILAADNPFGENFDTTIIYAPIFGRMLYSGLRFKID